MGIPDDYWSRPSINGGTDYHLDFESKHWTNKIHFEYHIDAFFQKVFTVLNVFGHLLFKYYDLIPVKKNGRVQNITFNNAFWNLNIKEKV